jgi:hypothetical protein
MLRYQITYCVNVKPSVIHSWSPGIPKWLRTGVATSPHIFMKKDLQNAVKSEFPYHLQCNHPCNLVFSIISKTHDLAKTEGILLSVPSQLDMKETRDLA